MFLILAIDDPDRPGWRQAVRPRHLPLLTEACRTGLIRFAGPMLAEDGSQTAIGSIIVLDLPDRAAVDRWLASEPFYTEGVWKEVTIRPCGIAAQPYKPLPGSPAA